MRSDLSLFSAGIPGMAHPSPTSPFLLALATSLTLLPGPLLPPPAAAQAATAAPLEGTLEPGRPEARELGPGQAHRWSLSPEADRWVEVRVTQAGVDVVVTVLHPSGAAYRQYNNPLTGAAGSERARWITGDAGSWIVEVRAVEEGGPGWYGIEWATARGATEDDARRLEADSLRALGEAALMGGRYLEWWGHQRRAIELVEGTEGSGGPEAAEEARGLGLLRWMEGSPEEGARLLEEAWEIQAAALEPTHPDLVPTLRWLGLLHRELGRPSRAAEIVRLAEAVQESVRASTAADTANMARSLNHLAMLYEDLGRWLDAEPLYLEALGVDSATVGVRHPDHAAHLNNLAGLYGTQGRWEEAELLYRDALAVDSATIGTLHADYAARLGNLAVLYRDRGRWAEAESLLREVLAVDSATVGTHDPDYAAHLNTLAIVYRDLSRWAEAEPLLLEVVAVQRAAVGTQHSRYAGSLSNLAVIYRDQGRWAEAEASFRQVLAIDSATVGTRHPSYAVHLNNLAALYRDLGRYEEAEPLLREVLAVDSATVGTHHSRYATSLGNLATLYWDLGRWAEAEPLHREALAVAAATVGTRHPTYATRLNNLSLLQAALGDGAEALALSAEALAVEQEVLESVFGFSAAQAMEAYAATLRGTFDGHLSMVRALGSSGEEVSGALEWALRRKGQVLQTLRRYREARSLLGTDPEFTELWTAYRRISERLARIQVQPVEADAAGVLQEERDRLEGALNRRFREALGEEEASWESVTVEAVRGRLPARTALVEFIQFRPFDFEAVGVELRWDAPRYLAFVLRADRSEAVLVELGEAAAVEAALSGVQRELRAAQAAYTAGEMDRREAALDTAYRATSRELYGRIWAPLEEALEGVQAVYLSPDGELSRVAFEALVDAEGGYLLNRYDRFVYLSSGRDLLGERRSDPGRGTVVFAGPNYDLGGEVRRREAEAMGLRGVVEGAGARGALQDAGSSWPPLPGAAASAAEVEAALGEVGGYGPVVVYDSARALEEVFKAVGAEHARERLGLSGVPRVLHVATHGFFLDRRPEEREVCEQVWERASVSHGRMRGLGQLQCAEDPLLRSGLVLAGANAWESAGGREGVDDGWLTAAEIALLDLRGVELAVLSACETGLGDVKVGEGVYGLRRAFELAGADHVLMSLHLVPDQETRALMRRLYDGLAAGLRLHEAWREAQLGIIEARTSTPGAAHPFFWASFILQGSPREE